MWKGAERLLLLELLESFLIAQDHSLDKHMEKQLSAHSGAFSAIQEGMLQKEKFMSQKYSIMLLGQLFLHFLFLLNVEKKISHC